MAETVYAGRDSGRVKRSGRRKETLELTRLKYPGSQEPKWLARAICLSMQVRILPSPVKFPLPIHANPHIPQMRSYTRPEGAVCLSGLVHEGRTQAIDIKMANSIKTSKSNFHENFWTHDLDIDITKGEQKSKISGKRLLTRALNTHQGHSCPSASL